MCRLAIEAYQDGNEQVIKDIKWLAKYTDNMPETPQDLCNQLFHTIYMGMSQQSSKETRERARVLSEAIGSFHVNLDIDEVYNAQRNLLVKSLNFDPKFKVEGGSYQQNQTLQNIQAHVEHIFLWPTHFANVLPGDRAWSQRTNSPRAFQKLVVDLEEEPYSCLVAPMSESHYGAI